MMNDTQRAMFREILDLNWEIKEVSEKVTKLSRSLSEKKERLRESMGTEAYNDFIHKGQMMFAPVNA